MCEGNWYIKYILIQFFISTINVQVSKTWKDEGLDLHMFK